MIAQGNDVRRFLMSVTTNVQQVSVPARVLLKVGRALRPIEFRGVARVLSTLAPLALGRGARLVPTVGGNRLVIDPASYFDAMMLFARYAEPVLQVIDSLVKVGDVAVDVGAQLGYVSNHLARRVGARGLVVSFEPDPAALDRLEAGLRANDFGWVNVVPCAAGDEESTVAFYLSPVLGWSTAVHGSHLSGLSTVPVRVRRVDDVLEELGHLQPSFVKVDVEGYEAAVVRGMSKTLEGARPFVILEVLPGMLRKAGGSDEDLFFQFARVQLRTCLAELTSRTFGSSGLP